MRILITGVTGFIGSHLVERLLQSGYHQLCGLSRNATWQLDSTHLSKAVKLYQVDLRQISDLHAVLRETRPEWIFHLAGYANPSRSFSEPEKAWEGNWRGTFNLYEAIAQSGIRPRVLFTSSGLVYGQSGVGEQLCNENDPLYPASPYAASKAAAELLSYQVTRHPGLDVIRVRCFNQIGPRQSTEYATANFARQIAQIEVGKQAPLLETGDLSGQRDLTDVRDMVRAFIALMEVGHTGEVYNAGSGVTYPMRFVLERMRALTTVRIGVRQSIDPSRRSETAVYRANTSKLHAATGWSPKYSLEESLGDLIDYWRGQAATQLERTACGSAEVVH